MKIDASEMLHTTVIGLALFMPMLSLGPPKPGSAILVVAHPWSRPDTAIDAVARADGLVLRGTAIPWIVVAVSQSPDFPVRLHREGAWMTFDASAIAGCAPTAGS